MNLNKAFAVTLDQIAEMCFEFLPPPKKKPLLRKHNLLCWDAALGGQKVETTKHTFRILLNKFT